MSDQVLVETHPLSQVERVVDTFVAPSKTFNDVLRSASWWLPYVLLILSAYALTAAIQTKVGWPQLVENEIHANPKQSDRMASLTPDQVATQQKAMRYSFQYGFYAAPLINLASLALIALVLWPTINFGFGGSATYGRVLCVTMYASLPGVLSGLLASGVLFAGRDPASFTTQALVGSNPGYYMETPGALKTFMTSLDVFSIWTAILLAIGLAIVARTKRSAGYFAVFGWFILVVLVKTAVAAVNS